MRTPISRSNPSLEKDAYIYRINLGRERENEYSEKMIMCNQKDITLKKEMFSQERIISYRGVERK
jgi:hypothetical protein